MGGDRSTIAVGSSREAWQPKKLERHAPGLGFRPWDPYMQDYDRWERAFLRHCIEMKGIDVDLQRQWLIDIGFKSQTIDALTKLELYAPGLGFHPWDPDDQDYDRWERAFLRHCIEIKGVDVDLHRQWLIDIGFKPQIIDAKRQQKVVRSEFVNRFEKRTLPRTLLILSFLVTGVSMIIYAVTGNVFCAATFVGAILAIPILLLMMRTGVLRIDVHND